MENTIKVLWQVREEVDQAERKIRVLEAHCIRNPRQTVYLINNARAIIDGFEQRVLQIIIKNPP